jgi:hypothetical protein
VLLALLAALVLLALFLHVSSFCRSADDRQFSRLLAVSS